MVRSTQHFQSHRASTVEEYFLVAESDIYDYNGPVPQRRNIVLVSLIILLALAGVVVFLTYKGVIKNPLQGGSSNSNLGSQIFEKTQNPLEGKIPETNPFAKVNPFKGVYKNPFQ